MQRSRAQFLELTEANATFALVFTALLADYLSGCRTLLRFGFDPVKLRIARVLTGVGLLPLRHAPDGGGRPWQQ